MLLPSKTISWEHLFSPVATQHISWEALFAHRNELLHDRLEPLHLLTASWELVSTLRNKQHPPLENHCLRSLHRIVHPNGKDGIFYRFMANLI